MISRTDFTELYDTHYDSLFRFVFLRVYDTQVTEDLLSKIFFRVLKKGDSFDPSKGKISTWLYTIASNIIIDYYRSHEASESLEEHEDLPSESRDIGREIDLESNIKKALSELTKLSPKTREIITLRIYEELSFHEIALIV